MRWAELEQGAPDIAAAWRAEFELREVVLVGTLRRDGSPRISGVAPYVLDDELYLAMMWRSRKALDLLRDPRLVVHSPICTNTGSELELSLHGRVVDVREPKLRDRYTEAVSHTTRWKEPFHLFAVAIESTAMIRYEAGEQSVKVWPKGVEFTRRYGETGTS